MSVNRTSTTRWELAAGAAICLSLSVSLNAASVTLAWDPPTANTDGTPVTELSGYRLYHGTSSGTYSEHIDVTDSATATFTNLQVGCSNYFAVTAVGVSGEESAPSEELAFYVEPTAPPVVLIPPAVILSKTSLSVQENASATFQARLDAQPAGTVTVGVSRVVGGDRYLGVVGGGTLVFSSSTWSNDQTVTIAALYDPLKTNRTAVFELSGNGVTPATILVTSVGKGKSTAAMADSTDAATNGIPDIWEITQLGGIGIAGSGAGDDPDQDGVSNLQEYIAGTDPNDPEMLPRIQTRITAGGVEVSFSALSATGDGYAGRSRVYTLERCTDIAHGPWTEVSSATGILGQNQMCAYVESTAARNTSFYRVGIRLQ